MQRHQDRLWAVLALSLMPCAVGQTANKQEGGAKPHHTIVQLTNKAPGGVVSGDPNKRGAAFVIRIQNEENQVVLPHWHPEDEHITVVKGTWYLGTGDRFDRSALQKMNVGDYAFVPKEMRHFGWSETETIVQIHGIGPFEVVPDDTWRLSSGWKRTPEDRLLRDPQAASSFRFKPNDRVRSKRGEGVIVFGAHSEKNKITQYDVQTEDGRRFWEFEEELVAIAQENRSESGPLSGVWECVSSGLPPDDMNSTLYVQQNKETVRGVLAWNLGGTAFSAALSNNKALEIRFDTPEGNFLLKAQYREKELSGEWSSDVGMKGSWECKKTESDQKR